MNGSAARTAVKNDDSRAGAADSYEKIDSADRISGIPKMRYMA